MRLTKYWNLIAAFGLLSINLGNIRELIADDPTAKDDKLVRPAAFDPGLAEPSISSWLATSNQAIVESASAPPDPTPALMKETESNIEVPLRRGVENPQGPRCGRYAEDACSRSGWPTCIGRLAKCSVTPDHSVGYVGGGSTLPIFGYARTPSEGTFGLDYSGHWFSRKVWLLWNHGRRYQGGAGAYETDGPRIIPE